MPSDENAPSTSEGAAVSNCECTTPGYCARHDCHKTPHWFRLCQKRRDYFDLWEQGIGPGQHISASDDSSDLSEPGLPRKALNFASSMARHLVTGRRKLNDADFDQRIKICQNCEFCDLVNLKCRHRLCGCRLRIKARWRTSNCPLEKWPTLDPPVEQ